MGWFSACGELVGSAVSAYIRTSVKLKKKGVESDDFCPEETKQLISKTLENCRPVNKDLRWLGRKITQYNLGKDEYFGSSLAIDASTKSTKRKLCITALKTAAKCICAGYNEDGIRAVTYSYLALRQGDFD